MYVCVYIYIYACVSLSLYMYIYREIYNYTCTLVRAQGPSSRRSSRASSSQSCSGLLGLHLYHYCVISTTIFIIYLFKLLLLLF